MGQVDFIVAADNATSFDPHVTYGMPAVFEPALMGERMPIGEVMRMTLLGSQERCSAKKAEQIGLVAQVVPSADVVEVTRQLALTIAGNLFLNLATWAESLGTSQEDSRRDSPHPRPSGGRAGLFRGLTRVAPSTVLNTSPIGVRA